MFKIGDFSKICLISSKALRHWDEMDLLKPAQVDRETAYRYYTIEQLYDVNRILALRVMGLSLKQIRDLLSDNISNDEVQGMFKLKRAEIQAEVETAQARLRMLEARLNYIDAGKPLREFEVALKSVAPMPFVSMCRTYHQMQRFVDILVRTYQEFEGSAKGNNWLYTAVFHDREYRLTEFKVEIGYTMLGDVVDSVETQGGFTLTRNTLPAVEMMATTVHRGAWAKLSEGYNALGRWIHDNGYVINGASREIFHKIDPTFSGDDFVTELQFPIAHPA